MLTREQLLEHCKNHREAQVDFIIAAVKGIPLNLAVLFPL